MIPPANDGAARPEIVWLTGESIGDADPALAANEDLPAWFILDRRLLARLTLSSKRLVFLVETLAELNQRRPVRLWLGDPGSTIAGTPAAVTFAPVPGFRRIAARSNDLTLYPWSWLRPPTDELLEYLTSNERPPSFKDFCRTTRPEVDGA